MENEYIYIYIYITKWIIYIYIYIAPRPNTCISNVSNTTNFKSLGKDIYIYIYVYIMCDNKTTQINVTIL